jgi:uncharacterized protein (TIGR02246 family)
MNARGLLVLIFAASVAMSFSAASMPRSARATVEAMFAAFNRHDARAIAQLYAPDALLTSSDFCASRSGRAEVQRTYQALFDAFPDIVDDVDTYVVEGDKVAVRFTSSSKLPEHAFAMTIMTLLTVRDGVIQSDDSVFDNHGRSCTP